MPPCLLETTGQSQSCLSFPRFLNKIVSLLTVLETNSIFKEIPLSFRTFHSTETTLLKVINNLLMAADQGMCSVLVQLDLTAAFNTIDDRISVDRLRNRVEVLGTDWFKCYLSIEGSVCL